MAANKCCCCRLLSCFACFSDKKTAQPHSSEIAPSSLNVIDNASPAAALTVKSSHVMSSAPAAVSGYDSQLSSPSASSSSQANASKDVLVMPNNSQSVNQSAVPSTFQPTVTSSTYPASSQTIFSPLTHPAHEKGFQIGSSSTPASSQIIVFPPAHPVHEKGFQIGSSSTPSSSTVPKESDHAKKIQDAADAVDIDNVDADLNDLINYISQLLDFIKEKKTGNKPSIPKPSIPKPAKDLWRSTNLKKLREVLSEGINVVKDVCPDVKTIAQGFLKGMGAAHIATTGLLAVANILERYEAISTNKEACLSLLKEMNILARHVKELQKRPELKEGMVVSIREATSLIVEASIACCTQIDGSKFSKFFSTTVDGEELDKFKTRLTETDTHMQRQINLCIFDAIVRPRKPRELEYPNYPKDTVGIEGPLKDIIARLEWCSDKNALAVILHGFGGMGKTTLADAVFARLFDANFEGCKYSFIRLFEDIATKPDVINLQKCILRDLKMGEEPKEIRRYEEGQQEIERMLEKDVAFIYIDNVLLPDTVEQGRDALKQLLPENMGNARKLRLLITARDKDAASVETCKPRRLKVEFYPIEILPDTEAIKLVEQKLEGNEKQIDSSQMEQIVHICGGIPKLLTVVAGFISSAENRQEAQEKYRIVMSEKEKNWKGQIGKDIACYVFAYENLDEILRDPFLDICSFFQGWDWEKISNIVGDFELNSLEKRALVTKDVKSMTARVHDVILAIGLDKKGERFRFTSASEIQKFLDKKKDKDLEKIKAIWSSDNRDLFYIPASKLDLMYRSLRVLILGNSTWVEGKCKEIFEELVIFSAGVPHLPFEVSKLKEFEKLSHLCYKPEDLQNLSQMPSNLRHIEFDLNSPAFQISSNCIQQLSSFRVLELSNAKFERLPQELGDLGNGLQKLRNGLQKLTIFHCHYLKELPGSISRLGSLRELRVSCKRLTQLPEEVGSLNSLQYLSLDACSSLEALPKSLGNLTSLQDLDLNRCRSLKALPTSFGKLASLQKLSLYGCKSLEALPNSFEELSSLSKLDLKNCPNITDLPYGFGKLTSLVELCLGCRKLSSIPESIGQLKLLDTIAFNGVRDLKELPDGFCNLSSLTQLHMYGGRHLEKLPDRFGEITSLKTVTLRDCGSLKKLPESFSQLKSLECLVLSGCKTLEELCVCFKGLSSLRELSLHGCKSLKKLPEDFDCLSSLEVLDLVNCCTLEGKWMQSMVKMKKLQILHIKGSTLLKERWEEIRRECDQLWPCAVYTGQGDMEITSRQLQRAFDSILTNGRGEPFRISGLPLNTRLLVMFDGQYKLDSLLAEAIDDIQRDFEMVYFGNRFKELPEKVVDRIQGHGPAESDVKSLFLKVFASANVHKTNCARDDFSLGFQMTAKIVSDEKGNRYLSCWELLSEKSLEEFVVKKCRRYLKLKQLVERGGESNIELLRELFASGEEEKSLGFLKNGAPMKVGLDQIKGKMILLDIRPANIGYDIPLKYLVEMYGAEKERFNFEIITIPVMQENTSIDVSEKFSSEVPWLVLRNPWQLTNAAKYFLVKGCKSWDESWDHPWEQWYPQRMRIIESNGTIAAVEPKVVLAMVNTWGIDAYPFTEEKRRECIEKEVKEMKAMSHLMFLFHHLESVSQQDEKVKEAMRQPKMIWLYISNGEVPDPIKNVLMELGDSIYIIYVPYPKIDKTAPHLVNFTHVRQWFFPLEESEMLPLQMQGMLNLSRDEVMRLWARRYSLMEAINGINHQDEQFNEMKNLLCFDSPISIVIMDKDGNLITTKGRKIVKLLSEEHPPDVKAKKLVKLLSKEHPLDDKAKELVQQFIEGAKENQETWVELERLLDVESEGSVGDMSLRTPESVSGSHSPDDEAKESEQLLEFEDVDSEVSVSSRGSVSGSHSPDDEAKESEQLLEFEDVDIKVSVRRRGSVSVSHSPDDEAKESEQLLEFEDIDSKVLVMSPRFREWLRGSGSESDQ